MVQVLSRKNVFVLFCTFFGALLFSQNPEEVVNTKDYKEPKQFEKFYKRRYVISAWQINQLKAGALVVRLKTNALLVKELIKQGNKKLAEEKRLEMCAININTMHAYLNNYNFSKVYFIYSHSSDSLLKGARENIFLDTNLTVDPKIVMKENFYLLAESDYAFNSSIGYIPEDSARYVVEKGNAVKEMAIVVKNKYGHQLKKPFPYDMSYRVNLKQNPSFSVVIVIDGIPIPFNVGGIKLKATNENKDKVNKSRATFNYNGEPLTLYIPKNLTYEQLSLVVGNFNESLRIYYQASPSPEIDKIDASLKPFLY